MSWLHSHLHIISSHYTDTFLFLFILENSDSSQDQHPAHHMEMGVEPVLETLCISRNLTLGFINKIKKKQNYRF
jgi:hypothetical protein